MARLPVLNMLQEHEWHYKEGNKVYCPTCGIQHRESTKVLKHRATCEYVQLMNLVKEMMLGGVL